MTARVIPLKMDSHRLPQAWSAEQQHKIFAELGVSVFMAAASKKQMLAPAFHLYMPKGLPDEADKKPRIGTIMTPWEDDREKDAMLTGIGEIAERLGCRRFTTCMEIWYASVPADQVEKYAGTLDEADLPRNQADRREALYVVTVDSEIAEPFVTSYDIIRPEDGGMPSLEKKDLGSVAGWGRIINLIPRPRK